MSMVIGSGVIANRFKEASLQKTCLIFAGSVNDSSIKDEKLIREEERSVRNAIQTHRDSTFVYFSSCSIQDPDMAHTPYVRHKTKMEHLVIAWAKKYYIFRLPQVIGWADNKSSLVNFLVDAIVNKKKFDLWSQARKNVIDIDDVYLIVIEVMKRDFLINSIVNIASAKQTSVIQLVREIEDFAGVQANYVLVNKGASYDLDISAIAPIIGELNIEFGDGYIRAALDKYFSHILTCSNE
jgi:nucleoside-diphosphate-sugar epimerase